MTSATVRSTEPPAARFAFSNRAEPLRLRDSEPHVHGYAWRHPVPLTAVVLLHGVMSHSGWFAEAADLLVDRGISVYALDRRGSGSSPYEAGHVDGYREWFDECKDIVRLAREETNCAVHAVGQCFEANIAIGAVLTRDAELASIVMLTPGLYVRPDYTLRQKARAAAHAFRRTRRVRLNLPLRGELFSGDPEIAEWIDADSLGAHAVTARTVLEIGRLLRYSRRNVGRLPIPMLVLEGAQDRLADNERNRAALERALGDRCRWVTFEGEHFLLAEPCRDAVLDELIDWVIGPPR